MFHLILFHCKFAALTHVLIPKIGKKSAQVHGLHSVRTNLIRNYAFVLARGKAS